MDQTFYLRRMWSFSKALDLALVDEEVERGFQIAIGERHGERVAYIALSLGCMLKVSEEDKTLLMLAGLLHDIGAVGSFSRYHGDHRLMVKHCLAGENLIKSFPAGAAIAPIVRLHHEAPDVGRGALGVAAEQVPLLAKIMAMADRVDVHLARRLSSRDERDRLAQWLQQGAGTLFYPELVPAFLALIQKESFWLDLEQPDLFHICLAYLLPEWDIPVPEDSESGFTEHLATTFADLIDQKSKFTSRHSASVAEAAERLANRLGWTEDVLYDMRLAGLLHDLGKLAIPNKILDKPGPLDPEEFQAIRTHTYYTHRLLTEAGFPERVVEWAAYHHERIDGKGYPFALDGDAMPQGSRIMVIADIFTALTEERPYRKALSVGEAFDIIRKGSGKSVDEELIGFAAKALG